MDTVQGSKFIALAFLTPLLYRGESVALCVGRFIPLGRAPIRWAGRLDGSKAYMVTVEESIYIALAFLTPLLCRDE
jgi:hypothetical protein